MIPRLAPRTGRTYTLLTSTEDWNREFSELVRRGVGEPSGVAPAAGEHAVRNDVPVSDADADPAMAGHGDMSLEAIDIGAAATGEISRLDSGGLCVFVGADAETGWLPTEITRGSRGVALSGLDVCAADRWSLDRDLYPLETSVPGICGDVRIGPVKRIAASVGEGSMAIAFVHRYLKGSGSTDAKPEHEPAREASRLVAAAPMEAP